MKVFRFLNLSFSRHRPQSCFTSRVNDEGFNYLITDRLKFKLFPDKKFGKNQGLPLRFAGELRSQINYNVLAPRSGITRKREG